MKFPNIKNKAVLSPMAGVTDVAFRTLAKRYGAAITYTEFLSSAAIVRNNPKTLEMLKTSDIESPVAVQLFGSNVDEIIKAAKFVEDNFPYTVESLEMDIMFNGEWMEVNGAGLVHPQCLKNFGGNTGM